MQSQSFSLGAILSITHGRMLVKDIDAIYEILNFMVDDELQTLALPRAAKECTPYLMEQFSAWIEGAHADVDAFFDEWDKVHTNVPALKEQHINQIWAWMETMETKYGATHEVLPIHPEDHRIVDPITELLEKKPDVQIITLDTTDNAPSPYGDINWKVDE